MSTIKLPESYCSANATQIQMTKHLQKHWGTLPRNPVVTYGAIEDGYNQIAEELSEMKDILDDWNQHGYGTEDAEKDLRDVCVDLTVFLQQLMVRTGIASKVEDDFYEIYKNNLTKVCWSLAHAENTVQHYENNGIACMINSVDDHWVVQRLSDGKVMKPVGFIGVELS